MRPYSGSEVFDEGGHIALFVLPSLRLHGVPDRADALAETFIVQLRFREGDIVQRGGDNVDVLGDVQLGERFGNLAAQVSGQGGLDTSGQEAFHGGRILGKGGFQLDQHRIDPFLPGFRGEESRKVGIDAAGPFLDFRLGCFLDVVGHGLRIRRGGFLDGAYDGGIDDFLGQEFDRLRNGGSLHFIHEVHDRFLERIHLLGDVIQDSGVLDRLFQAGQQFLGLLAQGVVHFLQEVDDLSDGNHQGLDLLPECRPDIRRQGEKFLTQLVEDGLEELAQGLEVRDVRIEEPGDPEQFLDDGLGVFHGIDRIDILEIVDGMLEHPLDPAPTEGDEGHRVGKPCQGVDDATNRVIGGVTDIRNRFIGFVQGSVHGIGDICAHFLQGVELRLQAGNAEARHVEQFPRYIQFLANLVRERGIDLLAGSFQVALDIGGGIAHGALDRIIALLQASGNSIDEIGDAAEKGVFGVAERIGYGVLDGFQLIDEAARQLEGHFLLADDAEEVENGVRLGQDVGHLFVDALVHKRRSVVGGLLRGVRNLFGRGVQFVPGSIGQPIVGVRHLADALVEEVAGQGLCLCNVLLKSLDARLDFAADIFDAARNLIVQAVGLQLDIADFVGKDIPPVLEHRDQDVLDELLRQLFRVETVRESRSRLFQFLDDRISFDVPEILDQLFEILECGFDFLEEAGPVDAFQRIRLGNRFEDPRQVPDQRVAAADQFGEFLGLRTAAQIQSDAGEDGIDDLVTGADALVQVGQQIGFPIGGSFELFDGFPDTCEFLFEIQDETVPRLFEQQDDLLRDIGERFHRQGGFSDIVNILIKNQKNHL